MTKRELLKKAMGRCVSVDTYGGKIEIHLGSYSNFAGGRVITDIGDEMFEVTKFTGEEKKAGNLEYYSINDVIYINANIFNEKKVI